MIGMMVNLNDNTLLLHDLPIDHPMANLHNSSAFARANDPVFARECLEAHVLALVSHHQTSFAAMEQQLASMPESELKKALKHIPYQKLSMRPLSMLFESRPRRCYDTYI